MPPPNADEILARASCLAWLTTRGRVEWALVSGEGAPPALPELPAALRHHLSPEETTLLDRPRGDWHEQDVTNASWRAEALAVLGWALQIGDDLPPWDTSARPMGLIARLGPGGDPQSGPPPVLVDRTNLGRLLETAALWHWRATESKRRRVAGARETSLAKDPDKAELVRGIEVTGAIGTPIDGDFPVFGRPYWTIDDAELGLVTAIALERHYAAAWLCNGGEWDDVPTPV